MDLLEFGAHCPPLRFSFGIGNYQLEGTLNNLYHGGILLYRYADLKGSDLIRGWAYHLVALQTLGRPISTALAARDGSITIQGDFGNAEDLTALLDLFDSGCRKPSSLFVEPALAYARQVLKNEGRGSTPPLEAARNVYRRDLARGYRPEWSLLYGELEAKTVLGSEFIAICEDIIVPLWQRVFALSGAGHV
jgi:exonuclease V gamma subunit